MNLFSMYVLVSQATFLNNFPIASSTKKRRAARQTATLMRAKAEMGSSIPIDLNSDIPQQSTEGFEIHALMIRSS